MIKYTPVPFLWYSYIVVILHSLIGVINATHIFVIICNTVGARNVIAILFTFCTFSFHNFLILWCICFSCTVLCTVVIEMNRFARSIYTWVRMRPFILHFSLPQWKLHFSFWIIHFGKPFLTAGIYPSTFNNIPFVKEDWVL